MTCNEFKKAFEAIFGECEWKAIKDDQVFQSDGWKEQQHRYELTPSDNHVRKI